MALSPSQKRLKAQSAALHMHATGKTNTAPAREAFEARWYRLVDEAADGPLTPMEREKRAEQARKAYFTKLAYRSSVARSEKAKADIRTQKDAGSYSPEGCCCGHCITPPVSGETS